MSRIRPRLRVILAAGAISVLAAGCTAPTLTGHGRTGVSPAAPGAPATSAATVPPTPAQPLAQFADCRSAIDVNALGLPTQRAAKLSFGCARIDVPLNYADPTGKKISLVLLRIHDSDNTAHTGSLLVNPGGPGGSGVNLALGILGNVSDALLTHFDLIGFDPRGVGLSTPIKCLSDAEKDRMNALSPDVLTPAGFALAQRTASKVANACNATYGKDLAQYNTVQTARDMDQIRQAVGDSKMNYLGFSYGTELGAQYIHLFPHNVRAAVLDGAVDPLTNDITTFANQVKGFEDAFDQFATWCDEHSPCRDLGNPRRAVHDIAARASRSPLRSSQPGETRTATSSIVYTGVLSALYSQSEWQSLGQALLDARNGDAAGLFRLADSYNERFNGHYTNIADANLTISCNDSKPGPSDATIRQTALSWAKRFPLFGVWNADGLFSCQPWQPVRTIPPLPTAPNTPHKILVVGNLHDPATPYQGAKDLARTLGNAQLLTWDGEGHTSYLQGSSCVDHAVDNYLITLSVPAAGTTCPR
ncbi:MAG TPA: alpha/beta hydrolase [Jatrophihabitans sp.]|nr:alpha/beta hydrolase [Jatrophihabitans sp.]